MIEILLVDDETYVTESLKATIPWADLGVKKVYRAASAAEAMDVLEAEDIDIMVTDIRMPGKDGLQLIEEAAERWPHLRCLLLTGYSDFDYAKQAIRLQAADYILKPVDDGEFVRSLLHTIEALKVEWEQADQYHRLLYNMKSEFGVLRGSFLHDLLLGRQLSHATIKDKLKQYEIPLVLGNTAAIILVQNGNPYDEQDRRSMELMEFAIGNIAEEALSERLLVWFGKAPHDCLVVVAELKDEERRRLERLPDFEAQRRDLLNEAAALFKEQVSRFLGTDISLIVSGWFAFPDGIASAYRTALSYYLSINSRQAGTIVHLEEEKKAEPDARVRLVETLSLYKPPTLIHLLESKQWDTAGDKINEVFERMETEFFTREHLYEVFLYVTNAFMYTAHKQGQFIHEIDHSAHDMLLGRSVIYSQDKLKSWALGMLGRLREELSSTDEYAKSNLVKQVQELVSANLGMETSVKTIADKVFLHPVYLSKVYKLETNESLSDYIARMRMEQAHYLLKHSNKRIYEITAELGYQNPQYFSKIFRKYYGMTPQEFRGQ